MQTNRSLLIDAKPSPPFMTSKARLRPRPWVVIVLLLWGGYQVAKHYSLTPASFTALLPGAKEGTPAPPGTSVAQVEPEAPAAPDTPVPGNTAVPTVTPAPSPTPKPTLPPNASNLPLRLPGPAVKPVAKHPRIDLLKGQIQRGRIFAAYRELAQIYIDQGLYAEAAALYREQGVEYRKKNFNDAALIEELKGTRYETGLRLFLERPATDEELKTLYTKASAEPQVGCYLGIHTKSSDAELLQSVGKQHGSTFIYRHYGDPAPKKWILECKKLGVIPQLAWEPSSLDVVKDDEYLRKFARDCGELDWPIFIRFASEMNGFWTAWHGNPKLYREKFRLVHKVLKRDAPRIATIWCVNNPPLRNVQDYYPGDDGCDWVGVNFYNVVYHDNKLSRPGFLDNPLALLDPIYKMYAHKKPIAICEYAASHQSVVDKVVRADFAIHKMSTIYGALPRLYPRVKLIDWFDINTMVDPIPGKVHNDYRLAPQPSVLNAYRRLVATPYYLDGLHRFGEPHPELPRAIVPGQKVRSVARFSVWSSLTLPKSKVYFQFGNKIVYASNQSGAHEINIDLANVPLGKQVVTALVYDEKNRFVNSVATWVVVEKG